jgi:ATP-dependent DNA ligase
MQSVRTRVAHGFLHFNHDLPCKLEAITSAETKVMTTTKKKTSPKARVRFIESMECLPVTKLPQGPEWSYEVKLYGYRLEAVKKNGETTLYSRRGNILNRIFH